MTDRPHVRIGEYFFRLAGERGRERTGLPSMAYEWRTPQARQGDITGVPGTENPTEDSLRWLSTSWAAGEGQRILRAGDEISEKRYYRSLGVDLSEPGQIRLAKQMKQEALEPASTISTVQGSTFTTLSGTSTVSGDDRIITSDGGEIEHQIALSAGTHGVRFYGHSGTDNAARIEGSTFNVGRGKGTVSGTDLLLQLDGHESAYAATGARTPGATSVILPSILKGNRTSAKRAQCSFDIEVRDDTENGRVVWSGRWHFDSNAGDYDNWRTLWIPYNSIAGHTYRYRVTLLNQTGEDARGLWIDAISEHRMAPATVELYVVEGGNNLIGNVWINVTGVKTSSWLTTRTFTLAAPATVSVRFKRQSGAMSVIADKVEISDTTSMQDSFLAGLGKGSAIWLYDRDASAPPSVFQWAPGTQRWTAVANIGANGNYPIARAHSEGYEYALLSNDTVYRLDGGGTQYLGAISWARGLAVAADRLWVLAVVSGGAVTLHRAALDQTAGLPLSTTVVHTPQTAGGQPDISPDFKTRHMAGASFGPVYLLNQSDGCAYFEWNEGTQTPRRVAHLSGFRGRAIAHSAGISYIVGEAPITGGGTKAAMWAIDHNVGGGESSLLNLPFERDGDPDSYLQDVQVYGPNVWVLGHVTSSPPKLRLWRVSLADPGGLFLEQEVEIAAGKVARSLAITDLSRMMASNHGAPWMAQDEYLADASPYLETSLFNFRLIDPKRLVALAVEGDFPEETSCELWYSIDGGTEWVAAGSWTETERRTVGGTQDPAVFKDLALQIRPRTEVATLTPTIFSVEAATTLAGGAIEGGGKEKVWTMVLQCDDETGTMRIDGTQPSGEGSGHAAARYVENLAHSSTLVDMEDFYHNPFGELHIVEIRNFKWFGEAPGEGMLMVEAIER